MLPLLLVYCNQATFINFIVWPVWRILGNGRKGLSMVEYSGGLVK